MKKTLYLMRHGETLFNQLHKIQGWCDSPLTERGIRQAKIAGEYFREQEILIEAAYCSTSERTSDTLELITELPYQRLKGLKEWNFGTLEGESEENNPPLPYGDYFADFGGEKELELRHRVASTLQRVMEETTAQTVLAVSHGASCRQFMRHWEHTSEITHEGRLQNCGILIFHYENQAFSLQEIVLHDFQALV
ncbi:phosphoglycerate mutase [Enterococcus florum]|uniref:Phosphoglycerate mutase n=1 Tax=Enterococcus florum TaxID=2480627 RepID=A0A4P5PC18_9ENTE|nr:histidine phosphatase family protein [Enterococcus florum]GCF95610.1 phosphoglycerate mutase [Enterococcus florum]